MSLCIFLKSDQGECHESTKQAVKGFSIPVSKRVCCRGETDFVDDEQVSKIEGLRVWREFTSLIQELYELNRSNYVLLLISISFCIMVLYNIIKYCFFKL